MATHTVVAGDTLWSIAQKYLGNGKRWGEIAKKNGIPTTGVKAGIIYVGDVLNLDGISGVVEDKVNKTSTPTIEFFSIQAGTDSTVFVTWSWDRENTENYQVKWYYDTGDNVWFIGSDSNEDEKQSTYSAPDNAKRVKVIVKPISETRTVNNKETTYWTANWSSAKIWSFTDNPPSTPDVPTVEIKDYTLTATINNLDVNGTHIQFEVVKDNETRYKLAKTEIKTNYVSYSCTVSAGSEYKVRCRAVRGDEYSEWSQYSDNQSTKPAAPSKITVCRATSETSVYLEWAAGNSATSYELEYTTKKDYFDGSNETTKQGEIEYTHFELTGLESGQEYFFRVRAVNDKGNSPWSSIKSIIIGKAPAAPTTWSSTTTAITGEPLTLNWVHNSEDESTQRYAQIELTINGSKQTHTIDSRNEADDKKTTSYSVNTSSYTEGSKIQWRVRTAGITNTYGEWSIERTVNVYAPPTLEFNVTDNGGNVLDTLTSFPFYIKGVAGPETQNPIGYHVSVVSNEIYETVDNIGNVKMVTAGQEVYSEHFDTNEDLLLILSAGSIDLENNVTYTVRCTASMDSGLTVEATSEFTVSWTDEQYEPNAEISINNEDLTASIRPYCENEFGVPIEGVSLSVYRREFDGSFTELGTGISNTNNTFITDPHPALDFARYRIVAITEATGSVSYYDVPGFPVGEKAVIIQWDDAWSNFNGTNEDSFEEPLWAGSMLKLPYNIDVSDDHEIDVSLVEYIGRKHPVSYYGTQLGESSTWKMEIDKNDTETLYGLRRLAVWTGDVYVREPSGSGYWASISVSFSQEHLKLTIPVTLSIKRVSGGA